MRAIRVAVMTDVHANLPALQAALDDIHREGCDAIVHLGDAVGIGPYPEETLRLLRAVPDLWTIQGNHDDWLARSSIDTGRPDGMSEGEWAHQRWVHRQVDPELRGWVARWPRMIRREIEGVSAVFVHYGLTESGDWHAPVRHSSSADLDRLFLFEDDVTVVFFGHDHEPMDHTGRARYINPGSLGCGPHPSARWVLATFAQGRCHIERRATPYDDAPLLRALDNRDVPERDFIRRVFYHGRKGRP